MSILRTLARFLYHSGRSKINRRHRLKYTDEFAQATAIMNQSKLDKDELTDTVLDLADQSEYSETELAEATYYLAAAGLDEDIPDALPRVVELAEFGLCTPQTAAESLAPLLVLFDRDPDGTSSMVRDIAHLTTKTKLAAKDVTHVIEAVAPLARRLDKSFSAIAADIFDVCDQIEAHSPEDYSTAVRDELEDRYRREHYELFAEE